MGWSNLLSRLPCFHNPPRWLTLGGGGVCQRQTLCCPLPQKMKNQAPPTTPNHLHLPFVSPFFGLGFSPSSFSGSFCPAISSTPFPSCSRMARPKAYRCRVDLLGNKDWDLGDKEAGEEKLNDLQPHAGCYITQFFPNVYMLLPRKYYQETS